MRIRHTLLAASLLALAGTARAQDQGTLPVLEQARPAPYPEQALSEGREADVLLQLDVGDDGRVLAVEVVEPAGDGFDEAAAQAARNFRFAPARDAAGEAVPSRILYRYRFVASKAPQLSVQGRVLDPDSDVPLEGFEVTVVGPDDAMQVAQTDDEGRFAFAALREGAWRVAVDGDGWQPETASFEVAAGRVAEVVLYPPRDATPAPDDVDEVVTVYAERRTPPEITERVLSTDEVYYLPGTNGDVVRAVQNLPGIARPPLNIGQLLVRGTSPEASAYYLDGARVPLVFHFAGLSTIVNSDALSEVAFLPGNYGVRYGRTLGGVVDLRFDRDLPEASSGFAAVDVFQATAFAEQRLGERTAVQLSGRRSYADAVLTPVLSNADTTVRAPRYWDASARVLHDAGPAGTLDASVLFSDDRFQVLGGMDDDEDTVQIALATTFFQGRLRWSVPLGAGWQSDLVAFVGPDTNAFQFQGEGEAYEKALRIGLREEVFRPIRDGSPWGARLGLDLLAVDEAFLYDVPGFGEREQARAWWVSPSPYAEASLRAGPVTVTPGVRLDPLLVDNGFTAWSLDPRLAVQVAATETTTVKGSFGRYGQLPRLRPIVAEGGGAAPLRPEVSWQASLGLEQQVAPWLSVEAVGFYNRLDSLIVGREDRFEFFTGPPPIGPFDTDPYANDGTGVIYGVEAQARVQTDRVTGLLAVTSSRSERVDRPGDDARLFAYDQPIVLNALGSVDLGRQWRVGARLRYGAGNPYTPVVNRVYLLDQREWLPVYGEVDSDRLPAFASLDLRVDKAYEFEKWSLVTYLDVQNATNRQNVEVMSWTFDYGEPDPITGLPILPTFGLRAEW